MYKLWATILKDLRVLRRDRIGVIAMFAMPVLLVIIVTEMQSGSFAMANRNRMPLLLCNRDSGAASVQFARALDSTGMFRVIPVLAAPGGQSAADNDDGIRQRLHDREALLGVVLPRGFSALLQSRTNRLAGKALKSFGLDDTIRAGTDSGTAATLRLYYHPVLQEPLRRSAEGALYSALRLVESRQLLRTMYAAINEKELPDSLERELLAGHTTIETIPVARDDSRGNPTVSEHNVPAWTIFAMFFVVVSLGSGIVREKLSGSFIRLKTLPTSYMVAVFSKQLTYLAVTFVQAVLVFGLGVLLFPLIGLPALHLPADWSGLVLVTLLCGACAVSYALCVGVFAETEEQANLFGALSIVILAAIGGLMIPDFMMTGPFRTVMKFSPLHWCLDAYYGLFLEGGGLRDVWPNVLSLVLIIAGLQGIALWGLKRKNLI
ncbi:MAG TPA: ABC transporter permease [Puia sp.]|nr:ABC transporter permease [Puia sp.]